MINQKKVYLGAIKTETIAARFYDYIAIISQGLNAKTNFSYSATDLMRIVRLFDRNSDQRTFESAEMSRKAPKSFTSSALPGREGPAQKRQRYDSVESSHSHNHKEDLILASQLYQKENNIAPGQATQSSIVASDQGLAGSAHQSLQDN